KRGPLCKQREAEDAAAATNLATTTANKSTTDRARGLEAQIARVNEELGKSENVRAVNPLVHVLSQIIPGLGEGIGSKIQATIAFVFELCIIGMMLGYEVMPHATPRRPAARAEVAEHETQTVLVPPTPRRQMVRVPTATRP